MKDYKEWLSLDVTQAFFRSLEEEELLPAEERLSRGGTLHDDPGKTQKETAKIAGFAEGVRAALNHVPKWGEGDDG